MQKAALAVLVHCVCSPTVKVNVSGQTNVFLKKNLFEIFVPHTAGVGGTIWHYDGEKEDS